MAEQSNDFEVITVTPDAGDYEIIDNASDYEIIKDASPAPEAKSFLDRAGENYKNAFQGVVYSNARTKTPTAAEVEKIQAAQGAVDAVIGELGTAAKVASAPVAIPLAAMMLPSRAIAGAVSRVKDALDPEVGQSAWQSFLSSRSIKKAMEDHGMREALTAYAEKPDPATVDNLDRAANAVKSAWRETFPEISPSDLLPNEVLKDKEGTAAYSAANIGNKLLGFGLDAILDPLSWIGFGTLNKVKRPVESLEETMRAYRSGERVVGKGLEESIRAGDKNLLSIKLPLTDKRLIDIKAPEVARYIDNMTAAAESVLPGRSLMQHSGLARADTAHILRSLDGVDQARILDDAIAELNAIGPADETVMRHAQNLLEFGDEAGAVLSKKQGIKLTPEVEERARQEMAIYQKINDTQKKVLAEAGLKVPEKNILDEAEKAKIRKELIKKYGEDAFVVIENGKRYDFMFSGDKYDYGRKLTDEAKQLQESRDFFRRSSKNLKLRPDSAKERNPLSSVVMEAMKREEGLKGPMYNPNKRAVVLENLQDSLRTASDLQYYKAIRGNYGVAPGNVDKYIADAAENVAKARKYGITPSYEDIKISKMTPDDFRPMKPEAFSRFDPSFDENARILLYPKAVADRVEAQFMRPSQSQAAKLVTWYQREWAKSALTSFYRPGKQGIDNIIRLKMAGVPESTVMRETAMAFGNQADELSRVMDKIPIVAENMGDLTQYGQKIKLNTDMVKNPDINNLSDYFIDAASEAVKQGVADQTLNLSSAAADKLKKGVEYINNNPVSNSIRKAGNYFDGLAKRAYFRHLVEDRGYDYAQATKAVADHFMDFTSSTGVQKNLRYVSPWISFNLKNVETLLPLALKNPGVINVMNPWDGHFKRAFEGISGRDREDYKAVRQMFPYMRSPLLGPALGGHKDIIENASLVSELAQKYVEWGAPDAAKDALSKQKALLMFTMPSPISAAADFLDPMNVSSTLRSPITMGITAAWAGIDPYTGEKLKFDNLDAGVVDRIVATAKEMNPYQYPQFLNKVVVPTLETMRKGFRDRLREGPITRKGADILKIQYGPGLGKALDELKFSKAAIDSLTQPKFFGMGSVGLLDQTYRMQQSALKRILGDAERKLKPTARKMGLEEVYRIIDSMKRTKKKMEENTRMYLDLSAKTQAARKNGFVPQDIDNPDVSEAPDEYQGIDQVDASPSGVPVQADPSDYEVMQ